MRIRNQAYKNHNNAWQSKNHWKHQGGRQAWKGGGYASWAWELQAKLEAAEKQLEESRKQHDEQADGDMQVDSEKAPVCNIGKLHNVAQMLEATCGEGHPAVAIVQQEVANRRAQRDEQKPLEQHTKEVERKKATLEQSLQKATADEEMARAKLEEAKAQMQTVVDRKATCQNKVEEHEKKIQELYLKRADGKAGQAKEENKEGVDKAMHVLQSACKTPEMDALLKKVRETYQAAQQTMQQQQEQQKAAAAAAAATAEEAQTKPVPPEESFAEILGKRAPTSTAECKQWIQENGAKLAALTGTGKDEQVSDEKAEQLLDLLQCTHKKARVELQQG